MLTSTGDGPPLELAFHCIVIPLDGSPEPSAFEDVAEEQVTLHQCMVILTSKLDIA
jgi:hypothetical protein